MERDFYIPAPTMQALQMILGEGPCHVAFNTRYQMLDVEDVFFFKKKEDAEFFADQKSDGNDWYEVQRVESVNDFLSKLFNSNKTNVMEQKNEEFLQKQVKFMGFGEGLNGAISQALASDQPEFMLHADHVFGKDAMEAVLHFKKSDQSDLVFFNRYDATLHRENQRNISRTFYVNRGQSITFKESCNLLNGRAVNKQLTRKLSPEEVEKYKAEMKLLPEQRGLPENWEKAPTYNAWVELNFKHKNELGDYLMKQYSGGYGFNLEEAVKKLPLKYNDLTALDELMDSLKKGNVQSVMLSVDGEDQKMFVSANPRFKAINVYDENMELAKKETYSQQHVQENNEHVTELVDGIPFTPDELPKVLEVDGKNVDMATGEVMGNKEEISIPATNGQVKETAQTVSPTNVEKKSHNLLEKKGKKNNLLPKKERKHGKGIAVG